MFLFSRHPKSEDGSLNPNQTVMIIGNNNVFEVGCSILSITAYLFKILTTNNVYTTGSCILNY